MRQTKRIFVSGKTGKEDLPSYKGYKPDIGSKGDEAVKWRKLVSWANKRKVKPGVSFIQDTFKNYQQATRGGSIPRKGLK